MKKKRFFWILLFIFITLLLAVLAAGWNLLLVRDYEKLHHLIQSFSLPSSIDLATSSLIAKMILGSLGFLAALALIVLLFTKLLKEMRLNQLQSEFLAAVSHELKTPIASFRLTTSLIKSGGLTKINLNNLWDSLEIELTRLEAQVDTLLEAARWQTKIPTQKKLPLHLETWIETSFSSWKSILGPGCSLMRKGDPLHFWILTDPSILTLIVTNILSNARKFSKKKPKIVFCTKKKISSSKYLQLPQTYWSLSFQDDGWGFPPKDSKKIFQRFFRSKSGAPHAIAGTGLGLYLASTASKTLGLTLTAQSQGYGQGAIFTISGIYNPLRESLKNE